MKGAADALGWAVFGGIFGVMVMFWWNEHTKEERDGRHYLGERIHRLEAHVAKQEFEAQQKPANA